MPLNVSMIIFALYQNIKIQIAKALASLKFLQYNLFMTYDEFNTYCKKMPHTTHVVQWGGADVWKIGGKVFAIGGWDKTQKPAFTFKTSELNYYYLAEKDGYRPAPYLASRGMKWIQQYDLDDSEDDDLKYYINESYRLVSLGLTKKKQKEMGLNQD